MIVQANPRLKQPRPAVLGIASGIFLLTGFGAAWGFMSAAFLGGAFQIVAFLLVGLVTLGGIPPQRSGWHRNVRVMSILE